VKPSPLGWPAVGVDADDRIGVQGIGHRGALVHARPQSVVVASGRAVRTPNWLNRPRICSTLAVLAVDSPIETAEVLRRVAGFAPLGVGVGRCIDAGEG
jgi:hypothetical protein